jgi:serine/threonine protein kinase
VAIKKMHMSKSLSDRSVLHDIFTEITCLEEFRLEPSVTDLYDYGVDSSSYYIVMKRYSGSLRDWRLKQQPNSLNENLSLYLAIFYEILKCFKTIHSHKVTHYDIKCDNILIDFRADDNQRSARSDFSSARSDDCSDGGAGDKTGGDHDFRDDFRITVGDFGECWMYTGDDDEFCAKNRGTEFTKSPEMLRLAADTRKDTDRYDRRKKTGTNALSDVWSLGCLFYEVLTGDYLFDTEDFVHFYCRLTSPTQELLVQEKLDKIQNNVYLVDFLKFVLVRDSRMRPSLDAVLQRFELVYRLLASKTTGIYKNARFGDQLSPPGYPSS